MMDAAKLNTEDATTLYAGVSSYKSIVSRTQGWAMDREGNGIDGFDGPWDVPFEFESEITSTSAVAEACDIESCTTSTRHFDV